MAKAKANTHYLISYDLDVKKGEKRDYDGLAKALKKMGAKRILKSQWVCQCEDGTTANDVSKKVLAKVDSKDIVGVALGRNREASRVGQKEGSDNLRRRTRQATRQPFPTRLRSHRLLHKRRSHGTLVPSASAIRKTASSSVSGTARKLVVTPMDDHGREFRLAARLMASANA